MASNLIDSLEPRRFFSITTLTTLSTFTSGSPSPASTVAMDSSGDLFGTATAGPTGKGYVWTLRKVAGSYETAPIDLADFPADGTFGENTREGVVVDSHGNLFGTNYDGYSPFTSASVGTFWELPKTTTGYGSLQLIKALTDFGGQVSDAPLSIDANDNIFGSLAGVVLTGNTATLFEYSQTDGFQHLIDYDGFFDNPGGIGGVESNLAADNSGNLYFTGINGGTGAGAVYQFHIGGTTINTVAVFDRVSSNPSGQIAIINNGNISQLFGVGAGDEGGFTNYGDLWELPITSGAAGALNILGTFNAGNGNNPSGGVSVGPDGNLYGTTAGGATEATPTVWESVNSAGVFSSPQTVVTFPVQSGSYPNSNLITDGTNLFGDTTSTGGPNGGTVFGVGPAIIPTTVVTPPATTYLLPTVTKSVFPTSAVAGQIIKGSFNVVIQNTTNTLEKGLVAVGVYAYDGAAFTLLGSQKHNVNLKPGKTAPFHINVKMSLNAGSYSVLPYAYDPTNQATGAATAQGLEVGPPIITLTPSAITAVKPASVKAGKTANFTVKITNNGNIDTSGIATIIAGLSIDGVTTSVPLPQPSHVYKIKVGKFITLHVKLAIPKSLTPGSYFGTVAFTQNGATTLAVVPIAFLVTG